MFGSIGGSEFLLIAVLALLLFGPRKLPEIGRSLGRALAELRQATHDFKRGLEREVEAEGLREAGAEIGAAGRDAAAALREAPAPAPVVARGAIDAACPEDGAPPGGPGSADGEKTPTT